MDWTWIGCVDILWIYNGCPAPPGEQLNQLLKSRNGLIVEYNETISAMLGCNTNARILDTGTERRTAMRLKFHRFDLHHLQFWVYSSYTFKKIFNYIPS